MSELLSDKDIIWLLENRSKIHNEFINLKKAENSDKVTIKQIIEFYETKIQKQIPNFKYKEKDKLNTLVRHIFECDGSYEKINQKCPKCHKGNVLQLIGGDVYYRVCTYPGEKRLEEIERLKSCPLFLNISAIAYKYDYECLNCGYVWKHKNK